jgi:hypothetical protein
LQRPRKRAANATRESCVNAGGSGDDEGQNMRANEIVLAATAILLVATCKISFAGEDIATLGRKVRVCLDREAKMVAPKPVDLDTAGIAVMARFNAALKAMRHYMYIPNFVPDPDNWEKEIEPFILKQAKEAVALERTR